MNTNASLTTTVSETVINTTTISLITSGSKGKPSTILIYRTEVLRTAHSATTDSIEMARITSNSFSAMSITSEIPLPILSSRASYTS